MIPAPRTHPSGSYRYLPAIAAYSAGIAAEPGFAIHAVRFNELLALRDSFERIDQMLNSRNLPAHSLAALELRSPEIVGLSDFHRFNDEYLEHLRDRKLITGVDNPIARTNVVPLYDGPAEPAVLTAFLVVPSNDHTAGTDFVVAGAGEMSGDLQAETIVAAGDVTDAGLARKVEAVAREMGSRITALGVGEPTTVNVYTAHQPTVLHDSLRTHLPSVERFGYERWLTRPPVTDIEFEMDCRRVSHWQFA